MDYGKVVPRRCGWGWVIGLIVGLWAAPVLLIFATPSGANVAKSLDISCLYAWVRSILGGMPSGVVPSGMSAGRRWAICLPQANTPVQAHSVLKAEWAFQANPQIQTEAVARPAWAPQATPFVQAHRVAQAAPGGSSQNRSGQPLDSAGLGLAWSGGRADRQTARAPKRAPWPQLQQNAQRHGHSPDEVPPPYRARWVWFGPDHILRNRESKQAAGWDADLRSQEGRNLPMPKELPFCFAGSMQPICVGGRLFVGDCQGNVYALDADDGRTIWTAEQPGGSLWPGVATESIVVFCSVLGYVTAWRAADGQQLWQFDTGKSITSAPALVGDRIYVASQSGRVHALRLSDGQEIWRSQDLDAPIQGGLCVAHGKVYVGTEAMEAVALDAQTGQILARSEKLMGQSFRMTWPVAVADRILFTTVPIICVGSEYINDSVIAGKFEPVGWDPNLKPAYPDVQTEQAALRRWLRGEGKVWEIHFALRADNLKKDYILATGVTEGCGMPPHPPAIDYKGRPLLWWASAHGTIIRKCGFGTNFTIDISTFDLLSGDRLLIDNGRFADQTTETDNLYAMSTGGKYLYLRQNFRGTSAINLETSEHFRISAIYRRWDGGGWHSPINYAQGDGDTVRVPRTPTPLEGRVPPIIAEGKLYFTEHFAVTCVETAQ
jgi:hypothetical protein